MKKRKVLVIGWDGADWKIINKLIDQGLMPSMKQLVENGVMGNLATLDPPFSPMLWTSIATGVRPDKHGILGFSEPTPNRIGVQPVSSTSRKVKAIWNILTQKGYKTHSVGWWPSHPAEPINGIMISNHYQKMSDKKITPLQNGVVHPPELSHLFAHFRIHASELTYEHLLPFVPNAKEIDQDKDKRLYQVAKNIAECSSIHAATTWIAENQEWDFLAMYLDTIDHFCHGFMNYHPPKMSNISDKDFEIYKDVIASAYRYHDMMLGRLMEIAGDDTTIMLISDHGFHSDHLRPKLLPDEPAGPAYQHRDYGVFCMSGPGIKKDEIIYGASLLDITPTLLHLFDLPIGEDMDGMPLIQAWEKMEKVKTIPSWETVEGEAGMLPKETQENPYEAQESLKQLVELGYIEEPDENMKVNVERTIKEADYNLARVYIGSRQYDKALPILQKLFEEKPEQGRFAFRLYRCYKNLNDIENCQKVILKFEKAAKATIISNEELEKIKKTKIKEDLTDKEKEKVNREKNKKLMTNPRVYKDLLQLDMIKAELLVSNSEYKNALVLYENISKIALPSASIFLQIANAYIKLKKWKLSFNNFNKVLEIDPDNNLAYQGLSVVNIKMGNYEEAIEAALESITILYNNPFAHYYLGEALFKIKDYQNAENALRVCLTIAPNFGKARNILIDIYENHLINKQEAQKHKDFFENKTEIIENEDHNKDIIDLRPDLNIKTTPLKNKRIAKEPIYVVSGLPRSGTSLMMQMLEKIDLEIFSDNKRSADTNNPKGYYEHEAVKSLIRDKTWLAKTPGKVVKIISHLLLHLPGQYNYKIIFMNRNIDEVVNSQHKMLVEQGKAKANTYPTNLQIGFKKNLENVKIWAEKNYNVDILYINHKDVIIEPKIQADKILKFLNKKADTEKMANVIDKKLYRTKIN